MQQLREETVNGTVYRIGRLNAKTQFHVMRRLAPVLAAMKPAAMLWIEQNAVEADSPIDRKDLVSKIFDAVGPLATALGELSDEASDYVIGACLASVFVNRQGSTWAPLANRQGQLMFDDLDLSTMLQLVLLIVQDNFSSFFLVGAGSSNDAAV